MHTFQGLRDARGPEFWPPWGSSRAGEKRGRTGDHVRRSLDKLEVSPIQYHTHPSSPLASRVVRAMHVAFLGEEGSCPWDTMD